MRRFLLERIHHPEIFPELHRVNHSKSISPMRQCNFKHARSKPFHRLRYISLASFGGNRERRQTNRLRPFRRFEPSCSRVESAFAADAFVNAAGAWEKKWGLRLNRLNAPPHYVGEQPPNTTLTDEFAKGSVAHLLAT